MWLEAFRLFNTVHANHYEEGKTNRQISWVPEHMNDAARYMAEYGLEHFSSFMELPWPETVGNLQFFMDRDMGMIIANPEVELLPNLGLGEVVDAPSPSPNRLKRGYNYLNTDECNFFLEGAFSTFVAEAPPPWVMSAPSWSNDPILAKIPPFKPSASTSADQRKGKAKMYEGYAFYEDGKLSNPAVEILESGALLHFSDVFANRVLDLEAHVLNGFYAKDILHYAVLDCLSMFENMFVDRHPFVADIVNTNELDLMPVSSVLSLMGYDDSDTQPPSKKSRRAASV